MVSACTIPRLRLYRTYTSKYGLKVGSRMLALAAASGYPVPLNLHIFFIRRKGGGMVYLALLGDEVSAEYASHIAVKRGAEALVSVARSLSLGFLFLCTHCQRYQAPFHDTTKNPFHIVGGPSP